MLRTLRLALALIAMVIKRRMAYRGDLLVQGLDELLRGLIALALLQIYLARTPDLGGWTRWELTFILGFAMVPLAMFHCLGSNLYRLSSYYIIEGNFDRVLLRPYPTFLQICLDRIAVEDLSGAVLGFVLMGLAVSAGGVARFDVVGAVLLVVLILSAFAIIVSVFMAFASTGFWFEDRAGMVPPVYNLMEFGRWPTSLFHQSIRVLITLVIPFSFTAFYPASWFTRSGQASGDAGFALLTPAVAVLAAILANLAWQQGIKRYASTGS